MGRIMPSLKRPTAAVSARRHFRVVLIKPSHYDDDGYVIRWYRSPMPANSLAVFMGSSTTVRNVIFSALTPISKS